MMWSVYHLVGYEGVNDMFILMAICGGILSHRLGIRNKHYDNINDMATIIELRALAKARLKDAQTAAKRYDAATMWLCG
jgi:hypothetical protein